MSTPEPLLLPDQVARIRAGQMSRDDYRRLTDIYMTLFERAEHSAAAGMPGRGALWEVTSTLAGLVDDHPERGEAILDTLNTALQIVTR